MFSKKECKRCGKKLKDSYNFCPFCGGNLKEKSNDWGILGKNDFTPSNNQPQLPAGLNMIFNSLVKNLEKQITNLEKQKPQENKTQNTPKKIEKSGMNIKISGLNGKGADIRVQSFGQFNELFEGMGLIPKKEKKESRKLIKTFAKDKQKKISLMKKEEPSTQMKRLADKILYELNIPGVSSFDDVSIIQNENSIEVKAISKNKAYFKIIPLSMPITEYSLEKGKLVLEMDASE